MRKSLLVVAVGDVGKNLVMGCLNDNKSIINQAEYLVVSMGQSIFPGSLPEIVLDGKIDVKNKSNKKHAEMLCAENRSLIKPMLNEKFAVIIIAGSDNTSIGVVTALSVFFKSVDILTFCFIQEPLMIMQNLNYKRLDENISYIRNTCDFTNVLSNHMYTEGIISMQECFKYMVRLLSSVIDDISMICDKEDKNVVGTGIDFMKTKINGATYAGLGIAFGENAVVTSVRSALCSAISNVRIENPKQIMIILRGDVSLLAVSDAISLVEDISNEAIIEFSVIYEECENHKIETLLLAKEIDTLYEICR